MAKFIYDYYSGERSEQFRFLKIPKVFFEDPDYKDLGMAEGILYSFLLEHMDYSKRSGWIDTNGRTYVILTIEKIQEYLMDCSEDKARDTLKHLVEFGLIEKKRRGQGKPDLIYVKDFVTKKNEDTDKTDSENTEWNVQHFSETGNNGILNTEKTESRDGNFRTLEPEKTGPKETKYNKTIATETVSINPGTVNASKGEVCPYERDGLVAERESKVLACDEYAQIIRENIDYDNMIHALRSDAQRCRLFDDFYNRMVEVMNGTEKEYRINNTVFPAVVVKSRMLKLTGDNLLGVVEQYIQVTEKIHNIRSYMISMLYNASFSAQPSNPDGVKHEAKYSVNTSGWAGTNHVRMRQYDWAELELDMQKDTRVGNARDGNILLKAG
ncbi:MAG: replication initiator protein A [Lachnospiraceae bacterium]|nr:replication initiator protein A [Lachnospiraceae bacterium]